MHFTKMHGIGNDYIYVYGDVPENAAEISRNLSDRHFGVGSDGMIYISKSDVADFKMRIFNADGSEAKMCGNGIRCVGKYVYDKGYTEKNELKIETLSGIKNLKLNVENGKVKTVEVDMGRVSVSGERVITVGENELKYVPVCVGNDHAVVFVEDAEKIPVEKIGCEIEKHEDFPDSINVEFVHKISENKLRMRVWERGSGLTMACGTGACASVAAAINKNIIKESKVSVILDGGELEIIVMPDYETTMIGEAKTVFEGETDLV